jgi:branched-chain amino acid transport system ATP-binding protein
MNRPSGSGSTGRAFVLRRSHRRAERQSKQLWRARGRQQLFARVERGSITGLIGPNGAGKSTLFNLVAGNIVPDSGKIVFDGQDVTGLKPHQLFHRGMLRTFQIAHEFSNMTALENLMMVPSAPARREPLSPRGSIRPRSSAPSAVRQKALDVIDFLKLGHVKNELAGNLSGGQKKLLELGRTMMVDAKVVLLDEVAAGVNKHAAAGPCRPISSG